MPMTSPADSPRTGPAIAMPTLRAVFWGTRGSVPAPEQEMMGFGGNTSCVEVQTADGRSLIFDGGTGIRRLGRRLAATGQPVEARIFLTHLHWDHIQGLPFFEPLYHENSVVRLHGPPQEGRSLESLLSGQMTQPYFPVRIEQLACAVEFHDAHEGTWRENGLQVAAMRVCHPSTTFGYRVDHTGASLAYVPDNELTGTHYPVPAGWYDMLVAFLSGVDCLVHDAMFTADEHPRRLGWGHSTFEQAVRLAEDAGVPRLIFFHHSPDRTDNELTAILERIRGELARRGSLLSVEMAAEGSELRCGGAG
jgi:phosphoribosyl 1,2-cyclic phosphodiesterase